MVDAFTAMAVLSGTLRTVFLAGGIVLAGVAVADWAVRTRRINPFGSVARFMRARVDPSLARIERQVVRVGGQPSATPWWALVVYVIVAALFLAALDMLVGLLRDAAFATSQGGIGVLMLLVHWTFTFFRIALIVRVLSSWFPQLAAKPWVRWSYGTTEWFLRPLRGVIPALGMIDITPIVAYFALQIAEWLVMRLLFSGLG